VFGIESPAYRTPVATLPRGDRSEWDYVEAGAYGVSLPLAGGSNGVWYMGRDTALGARIGVAATVDYTTWTRLVTSSVPGKENVVVAPSSRCDGGGFIGGFGITQLPGGTLAALVSAQASRPGSRADFFGWCLHTSTDGVHWTISPASPVYRLGRGGAADDYITEVRGLLALAGGYLVLAQVVNRHDRPLRRVGLYFSPDLVTWDLVNVLRRPQTADSQDHGAAFVGVPGYAEPLLVWEGLDSRTTAIALYISRLVVNDSGISADLFPKAALLPSP